MSDSESDNSDDKSYTSAELKDMDITLEQNDRGPEKTPFYGGFYKLKIEFNEKFPSSAPTVYFETTIFHPNVYSDGQICIEVINHWNSNYSIIDILEAVYLLLVHPNENSPANVEAGEMIKNDLQCVKDKKPNPHTYEKKASEINAKYAYPI